MSENGPMSGDDALRLRFDAARCDGWGMCTVVFPEGISLDPWGFAHVTGEQVVDRKLQKKARRAAACCPRQAISLLIERSPGTPNTAGDRQETQ